MWSGGPVSVDASRALVQPHHIDLMRMGAALCRM
jgi:hypothetical protein